MTLLNTAIQTVYTIDAAKSTLTWKGKKVFGGGHTGTLTLSKGSLTMEDNKLREGNFEIDMRSLVNTDITDPEYNRKLIGHLKSDDFFRVEKYPVAHFVMKEATWPENGRYQVTGNLTVKGITNTIGFPVKLEMTAEAITVEANISVDRTKFNIRFGSESFFNNLGDKAIQNNFDISLYLVAIANESKEG